LRSRAVKPRLVSVGLFSAAVDIVSAFLRMSTKTVQAHSGALVIWV
jgi:hypothetical protein